MNCPLCGAPMEEGNLTMQKYPLWFQGKQHFFRGPDVSVAIGPPGEDASSMFLRSPFPVFPGAMLCRKCGMVCFSGNLIEKPKKS